MIKMKKFFAQFKSLDLQTGIEAALGAVLTLFSIFSLSVKGWYDQLPVYKDLICGLTTWSGYNKQADLWLIRGAIIGLPLLFILFIWILLKVKPARQNTGREEKTDREKAVYGFMIGYAAVLLMVLTQQKYMWQYAALYVVLLLGYLLCRRTKESYVNCMGRAALVYGALTVLFLAAGWKVRVAQLWQVGSLVILGLTAVFFLLFCGLPQLGRLFEQIKLEKYLQILLPLGCLSFVHFRYQYEVTGQIMELFYSGRWKYFCILLTLVLLVWAYFCSRKKSGIYPTTFVMAAMLRVFTQPEGLLSMDYFHNGEITLPMQQLMSYHKLPYRDLIPIHGLCDYYYGLIDYLFFDGSYLSLNAAKIVGDLAMAFLLALVIYYFMEHRAGILLVWLFMPFLVRTAGMRYLFLFILFLVLFSKKLQKLDFLYAWVLLSIFAIAWNASIGGTAALAFLPLVLCRSIPKLGENCKEILHRPGMIVRWLLLIAFGIAFIPLFLQIVIYLKDNTGTTLYVNGMAMFEDVSEAAEYLLPGFTGNHGTFFIGTFGFLLPLLLCLYFALKKEKSAAGQFITLLICYLVLINYAFVRFDEGGRALVLTIFFGILTAAVLLYEHKKWLMILTLGSLMLWLSQDAPLATADSLCLIKEVPASVEMTIGGKKIEDPVVYVTDAGIPNMGTGFVQGNTLQSLQNIGTVLQADVTAGKTWLDATNAVANAVLFDRECFFTFTSVYNISNRTMQEKAIAQLSENLPDLILLAPYIQFDEATFSDRSILLYDYLMEQDYVPYKYENVIYLLRGESHTEAAKADYEAYAQLLHKTSLQMLPAVWAGVEEKGQELQIPYRIERTDAGFDLVFDQAITGMDIDLLQIDCDASIDLPDASVDTAEEKTAGQTSAGQAELSFETEVSAEGSAHFTYTMADSVLLPLCTSPYFTCEKVVERMHITLPKKLADVDETQLHCRFYKIQ
ncbi:hypothetical protein KQI22_12795 [Kineothrix sp. MSJ-39]|uniref:hypothetical protein n=1 Tax=Kineothrix sp. MSJ-39 TaxID=2841533 RepID=UPI001C0F77F4|nr:hypothetical protein [Kineothrix sp. MSJ-39]MBU5430927.1 hypothetical protein [Kineothrix sp. MSJ-39]